VGVLEISSPRERTLENLNDILVFVRVVDKGSFISAARDLQISASAASKHIYRLEESLGVQLLKRSTRRLTLTESGSDFYAHCAKAIVDLQFARDAAVRQHKALRGVLRAQATVSVAKHIIVPAVRAFIRAYPGISVNLTIGPLPANLIEQNLDVVFVQWVRGKDASLEYRTFAPVKYFVCAAPSYLDSAGRPEHPKDLARFNCLVHEPQIGASEWRFSGSNRDYRVKVHGNLQTNNGIVLYDALISGLGIARMPDYMVLDDIRSGRLISLFENAQSRGRAITAAYPRRRNPPARLQAFLEFMDDFIGKNARSARKKKK
jgi:DNA-binding transcriptional LysR family regulator